MDRTAVADVSPTGAFARKASTFRNAFDANGAHPPEAHRYVLVVSLACPWATRCLAALRAKGLEDVLDVAVTHPVWGKTRPNDPNDAHAMLRSLLGQISEISVRRSPREMTHAGAQP